MSGSRIDQSCVIRAKRIVDRLIAVRMVFTHHVADDARRLAIGLARAETALLRPPQDAAVDGFQPVAHIGQCARATITLIA